MSLSDPSGPRPNALSPAPHRNKKNLTRNPSLFLRWRTFGTIPALSGASKSKSPLRYCPMCFSKTHNWTGEPKSGAGTSQFSMLSLGARENCAYNAGAPLNETTLEADKKASPDWALCDIDPARGNVTTSKRVEGRRHA
jgi:hypothetical protein